MHQPVALLLVSRKDTDIPAERAVVVEASCHDTPRINIDAFYTGALLMLLFDLPWKCPGEVPSPRPAD